ncbi:hypothetical protein HK405_013224, partial [Cladochytrium tenue]
DGDVAALGGEVGRLLGYEFRDGSLAIRAVTHVSSSEESYERLEFLGDAILDCLLMSHFFRSYPDLDPERLCDLRQAAVCNESFARLTVRLGLHKRLRHRSPLVEAQIAAYLDYLASTGLGDRLHPSDTLHEGPKVLGDVFEAATAAVFLDVGGRLDAAWAIMGPLLQDFLDDHVSLEVVTKSPIRQFHEDMQKMGFTPQDIVYGHDEVFDTSSVLPAYECRIVLCGEPVASERANSPQLAKRLACKGALAWVANHAERVEELLQRSRAASTSEPRAAALAGTEDDGGEDGGNGATEAGGQADAKAERRIAT